MTTDVDKAFSLMPRTSDFFLARQPILDRSESVTAYELLFRRAHVKTADVIDDLSATASVIAHASELGLENVVGGARGFVNVDATVLMSDVVHFLPAEKIVLEILETVEINRKLIDRVAELAKMGFTFALDDVTADSKEIQSILPLIKIIKVDITGLSTTQLRNLASRFKPALLLAEKVETVEQFKTCLEIGFDYFQGYYFAKPVVLTGKKLDPSRMTIMQVLSLLIADAETTEIEKVIKQDASLGLTLLRLVNAPGRGVTMRIDSLSKALMVLGRRQLQYWLQILLYAEPHKGNNFVSPLLLLASTRGKLLELIAAELKPGNVNVANTAFTVGIMSLMDALFGQPMEKILQRFTVVEEVNDALLQRKGFYGDLLALAEHIERIEEEGALLVPILDKLGLQIEDLQRLEIEALEWSESISRAV